MNNRGAMAFKTIILVILLIYGAFVGYKFAMTYFTKSRIVEEARNMINKIKGPVVYSKESAEGLLMNVLKNNDVYENEKINQIFVERTEDEKFINYELKYRIRTDLLLFKTDWETVEIKDRAIVAQRN